MRTDSEIALTTSEHSNVFSQTDISWKPIEEKAKQAREIIVDMAATPTGCHIGGSLSVIDILIAVYDKFRKDQNTKIVLSKGHAAAALYATLYVFDIIKQNPANDYGSANSIFTGHPNSKIPGVSFSTGSLGHGIPYAQGWALANRLNGNDGYGIAVVGDGELQEGLCWESFQIAQAKSLDRFICIVDCNNAQNDGYLKDISPMSHLDDRFRAFGFDVMKIDGHNIGNIQSCCVTYGRPLAILAETVKGKGVKAIEGNASAHYAKIAPALAKRWKRSFS